MFLCRCEVEPEPEDWTWALLWLKIFLRWRGVVFSMGGLVGRTNRGAWSANGGIAVIPEVIAAGGEVMAEELIGFHRLWDLEVRRTLPETARETCCEEL